MNPARFVPLSLGHRCPSCGGRYHMPVDPGGEVLPHNHFGICWLCYRTYSPEDRRRAVWLAPLSRVVVTQPLGSMEYANATADMFVACVLTITRLDDDAVLANFDPTDWLRVDVFGSDGYPNFHFDNPALTAQVPHYRTEDAEQNAGRR